MVSVTDHVIENIHRLVQHFCTTTCSTYTQLHGYVCVHVREAKVVSSPATGPHERIRHLFRQSSSQDPGPQHPALSPALREPGWWRRQ